MCMAIRIDGAGTMQDVRAKQALKKNAWRHMDLGYNP